MYSRTELLSFLCETMNYRSAGTSVSRSHSAAAAAAVPFGAGAHAPPPPARRERPVLKVQPKQTVQPSLPPRQDLVYEDDGKFLCS